MISPNRALHPCSLPLQRNTLDGWVIRKARPGQQRTSGRTMRGAGRTHAYKGIIDVSRALVPPAKPPSPYPHTPHPHHNHP